MKKRSFSVLLSALLVVTLCAGCGSGSASSVTEASAPASVSLEEPTPTGAPEPAPVSEAPQTAPEASEVEASDEDNYVPISYPIETDTDSLSIWFLGTLITDTQYSDYSEHHALALLEEKTGIKLELIPNSFQTGASAMDLMLASGDYPDFIADFTYSTGMDGAINDDVVVALSPYLSEFAPDYYRYLTEDDNTLLKRVTTDDGNVGVFVRVGAIPETTEGPMTFQYMLDETGFTAEELDTVDEYREYLTALKNTYGMASPLYLPGDFVMDNNVIASGFDVALKVRANSGELSWYVEDGEVKFGYLEDGFAEYVTELHDWYAAGLMDSDTASHAVRQDDYIITAIANHSIGVFERPNGMLDMLAAVSGETVVALPYPSQKDGEAVKIDGAVSNISGENGTVITTGCEDIETAVMFMNYLYTEEYEIPSNYGLEGESFYYDEKGEPQFEEWMYSNGKSVRSYIYDYVLQPTAMVNLNLVYPGTSEVTLNSKTVWANSITNEYVYPSGANLNAEESNIYSQYAGDIVALVQEHTAKFITGDEPLDQIPAFQQMLIDSGIEELIAVKQAAYDRYMD